MISNEQVLGGTMNRVVKVGDTVSRQIKGNKIIHTYLQYLEKSISTRLTRVRGFGT